MRTKEFQEEEILKKAIAIFWRKGYNATSLHDLIEELGIGRSSIYHAFGDKQNLYLKALDLYQKEGIERIKAKLANSLSAKQAIADFLSTVVNSACTDNQSKGCFKINAEVEVAPHDEQVKKLVCEDNLMIEEIIYEAIKKGQNDGEINKTKDPKALTHFVCNTITGMRVYAKVRTDRQFFDHIVETTMSVFD
ncbi:TetR/AcrR family transcriptional regulator [Pedobacter sp.]|uniref:TetR/AcrR family transcriptional regulator n=1 Tax=Pedobacter sp. TaxID=1411316 RepID=UPI003D7FAB00